VANFLQPALEFGHATSTKVVVGIADGEERVGDGAFLNEQ